MTLRIVIIKMRLIEKKKYCYNSQKKKRKKDYCYNWDSIIKHLKGYKISKVGEYKASMKSFGGAKIRCIKDHMKP